LESTLAPPVVLDQNASTFLIAAPPNGNALKLYTLTHSGNAGVTLTGPANVPVPAYTMPAPAPQPGTNATLDTSDNRFVNAGTQVGESLWQVHTIDVGGLPTPRFYQVNTTTNAVTQSGLVFASATSADFNAAIAANADNDVFLTWSSTDASASVNAQVRYAACDHQNGPCMPVGAALFSSTTFSNNGRWGDYAAVTIDPLNPRQAWFVNEKNNTSDLWGSRIGSITLP
jgi:hypothetical protein